MSLTKLPLSMMADGTDGNLITYDASGNPAAVATGSSSQLLTSAGAGSPPTFTTVTSGYTLGTDTATSSGSAITFGSIPSGVSNLRLFILLFAENLFLLSFFESILFPN